VEWATGLRNKYLSDIFFRTEFNVITLQVLFAIILSLFVAVSFNYIYKDILQTVLNGITENLRNNGTFSSADIVNSIGLVKSKNFFSFFIITISITAIFSYIIAKMTLSPTRNALKSQKRFVSDIAHELRTPLSVIKTNSEVALLDDIDHKIKKIFKNNIEELDRVSVIINNLLTFNNLVHPEQVRFKDVNMGEVVDISVKKLEELIKTKDIKLNVKKIKPYTVWGNAVALEQITINILKNAINYNREGGTVSINLEPDYKGNVVLCIEDNGIGISQNDLLHIFEPFYRAEKSRSRQMGSSGLGLTIVSELVKLHSGRISVSSHLREGTSVTIMLPFKNTEVGETKNKEEENEVFMDYLKSKKV
jgi:signal transduction histidine kinase